MGRWTQYDEDEYRLPEGMKRVGYDADTQRYTFQQGNQLLLGEPGAKWGGTLTRQGHVDHDDDGELEGACPPTGGRRDGYQPLASDQGARPVHPNRAAYRMLLPFLLLIGVFLLIVWRFVLSPSGAAAPHTCPDANPPYRVEQGDSCWSIAEAHGTSVAALQNQTLNPDLVCEKLRLGDVLCLPMQV